MKNNQMHVVLGGYGAIGNAVLQELRFQGLSHKAIEHNKDVPDFLTIRANILDSQQLLEVTAGATHVYLCIGLPYSSEVWTRDWPRIMSNVIKACIENKAQLVFFDNVYMYGPAPLSSPFDEKHRQSPQTKKGKARKVTTDLLLAAIHDKKIQAVIGRSADFYGPGAVNSPLYISFLERILLEKKPQLLSKTDIPHTYAYTKDNARALVTLACDESTYGEVWHLPAGDPITMSRVIDIFNSELKTNYAANVIPNFVQKILSLFIKPIREVQEMLYQFDYPYVMSSRKFMDTFPEFKVTAYEVGLKEMVKSFKK